MFGRRSLWITVCLVLLLCASPKGYAYSVLTHQAVVDSLWKDSIEKLLRQKYPKATAEELNDAHAYAYGGCIVHDIGYYPFGSHFFTDVVHYVRSGDFVISMLRE